MPLPEFLTDPVPLAVLTLVIFGVIQYQRTLSWTEYREIHRLKRRLFPTLDRVWPHFVHAKGGHDDPEFIATVEDSVQVVFSDFVDAGASPHVINSIKQRQHPETGKRQYTAAHVRWAHDDGSQTEAYLFRLDKRHVDVYAHHEPGVVTPVDHLSGPQTDGDPRGVVHNALFIDPNP